MGFGMEVRFVGGFGAYVDADGGAFFVSLGHDGSSACGAELRLG